MTRIDMDGQRPIMKGFTKEKERQLVFKEYFGITLSVSDLERIKHRDTRLFSPDPCRLQFSQQRSTVARGHYLDGFVSFYINPIFPQDDNCSAEYNPGGLKEQVPGPPSTKGGEVTIRSWWIEGMSHRYE
jgi:hypothetical protein